MFKNKFLFFVLFIFLSIFNFIFVLVDKAFASLEITEIMYNLKTGEDTGREWIEIYNPESTPIDVTKIKFYESNTSHGLSTSSGTSLLDPLSYAVISDVPSKFMIDNPNYSGILFDSGGFSLSNTGETLELKNASGTSLNSTTYYSSTGAKGDGNSLQKINNIFVSSIPTPGLANVFVYTSTTTPVNGSDLPSNENTATDISNLSSQNTKIITKNVYLSSHSGTENLSGYNEKTAFEISAGRERMAIVGSPLEFDAKYTLLQKDQCTPDFRWSFGDGFEASDRTISHTYKYPGEYQIVLNSTCGVYNAVSRTAVKVASPSISIISLENGDIEISNKDKTEINLGMWKITPTFSAADDSVGEPTVRVGFGAPTGASEKQIFIFPRDTIVSASSSIILSKEDLGIGSAPERISLDNPSEKEVAFIDNKILSQNIVTSSRFISVGDHYISVAEAENLIKDYKKNNEFQINKNVTIKNDVVTSNTNIESNNIDILQTATVAEAVESTSTKSFWAKLIDIPINGMKSFAHIFYDF